MEVGDIITVYLDGNPIQQKILEVEKDGNGNVLSFTAQDIPVE